MPVSKKRTRVPNIVQWPTRQDGHLLLHPLLEDGEDLLDDLRTQELTLHNVDLSDLANIRETHIFDMEDPQGDHGKV